MRAWWMGGVVVCVSLAVVACIADKPADVAPAPDGGASSSSGSASCGPPTATPGGCVPSSESYCFKSGDPSVKLGCYPHGNHPQSCIEGGGAVITCLPGGRPCGSQFPCCYGGTVRAGTTCAATLDPASTLCEYEHTEANEPGYTQLSAQYGGRPCLEPGGAAGRKLAILCVDDAECARYDAGTCKTASMAEANLVVGVCSDY